MKATSIAVPALPLSAKHQGAMMHGLYDDDGVKLGAIDGGIGPFITLACNAHRELVSLVREFVLHHKQGGAISDTIEAAELILHYVEENGGIDESA